MTNIKFPSILKNRIYIIIYLYIFVNTINKIQSSDDLNNIIIIPFKYYQPKVNEPKETKQTNIFTSWLRQKIYLIMENSEGKKYSMILTMEQMEAHSKEDIALISSDDKYIKLYTENISDICSFNCEDSKNFKCQTSYNIFLKGRDKCCIVEDNFIFYSDENLKEKKTYKMKFIHSTNKTNICLFGSLQKYVNSVDKSRSFLDQLKILSGAKSFTWTLKYTSIDSGLFIFGDIINNKKINFKNNLIKNVDDNYESIYAINLFDARIFWKMNSDKIFFGNKIIGENDYLEIETNIPFILLKKEYYRFIKESIFHEYFEDKICQQNIPEYQLSSISCNKKIFLEKTKNLNTIPSITFQIKSSNLNITFSPNELFRIKDDDIYFLIAHRTYKDSQCFIGSIFLSKYTTIFDNDSKQIKILKSINFNKNIKDESKGKIILILFLSIILSGIIFGFIGLKYGKKIYQSRKKKANELNDDYEYMMKTNNDINFEKKYGLFINDEDNKNRNPKIKGINLEMINS